MGLDPPYLKPCPHQRRGDNPPLEPIQHPSRIAAPGEKGKHRVRPRIRRQGDRKVTL